MWFSVPKQLTNFFLQSLKVGSASALILTIIAQSADKIFKPSYRTDSYGKNSIILEAIKTVIVGIKLNNSSVIGHLKHSAQPKLRVYFSKKALENINEEVNKGDNFNQ